MASIGENFESAVLFAWGLTAFKTVLGSCYTSLALMKHRVLTSIRTAHSFTGKTFEVVHRPIYGAAHSHTHLAHLG